MMMTSGEKTFHNPKQEAAISRTEGIHLIDAGAGTGKTSTITRRYVNLLKTAKPSDILLLTFTDNAATNMRQKIIQASGKDKIHEVMEAPISTFHSYCNTLLKQEGTSAPTYLGFEEQLDSQYSLFENDIMEMQTFESFYERFRRTHAERFGNLLGVMGQQPALALSIIKKLCCKGIFPTSDGWYLDGGSWLRGDSERFWDIVAELNAPREGANGRELASPLSLTLKRRYSEADNAGGPAIDDLMQGKKVNEESIKEAFDEQREELFSFIHTLYREYISQCLQMNKLNFDFLIMFAFILLSENHSLRERIRFRYLMVDEFQDTNEIQFMLVMLLMRTNNLFAVGDWKQGIYSFRNATIENITHFSDKMQQYKKALNRDMERITYDISVNPLEFTQSYRSSQDILTFSERALRTPASSSEQIDEERAMRHVTKLEGQIAYGQQTGIRFFRAKDEKREQLAILRQIQEIISSKEYVIKDGEEHRPPHLGDIAVLCRSRHFGLELQYLARRFGIPLVYEGGIELFSTEPALLLLAWLRVIVDATNTSGWVTIMEREGYQFSSLRYALEHAPPSELLDRRNELSKEHRHIASLAQRILSRYGSISQHGAVLISHLDSLFRASTMSLGDLISYMEENIRLGNTMSVSHEIGEDAVTVQTIHGAKGLEYPIVFMADCNTRRFPSFVPSTEAMFYDDILGLRMRKVFAEKNGFQDIFQSWQATLLTSIVNGDYDEERRLLYVAITRARQYLYFTANRNSSPFFDCLHDGFEVEEDPPTDVEQMEEDMRRGEVSLDTPTGQPLSYTINLGKGMPSRYTWMLSRLIHGYDPVGKEMQRIAALLPAGLEGVCIGPTWIYDLGTVQCIGTVDLSVEQDGQFKLYLFGTQTPEKIL